MSPEKKLLPEGGLTIKEKVGKTFPWVVLGVAYWLFPGDFDFLPFVGQVDDVVLGAIIAGYTLSVFVKNNPQSFKEFLKSVFGGKNYNNRV